MVGVACAHRWARPRDSAHARMPAGDNARHLRIWWNTPAASSDRSKRRRVAPGASLRLVSARVLMLPDLLGPEIELRGEGVVSRAAEGEIRGQRRTRSRNPTSSRRSSGSASSTRAASSPTTSSEPRKPSSSRDSEARLGWRALGSVISAGSGVRGEAGLSRFGFGLVRLARGGGMQRREGLRVFRRRGIRNSGRQQRDFWWARRELRKRRRRELWQ